MHMVVLETSLTVVNIALIGLPLVACFLSRHNRTFTFWFSLFLCTVMALDILAIWVG